MSFAAARHTQHFPERRVSPVAFWAKRTALFSLVLLITDILGHRLGLIEPIAFFWTLGIVFLVALVGMLLAAGGLAHLWESGQRAGRASILAAFILAMVLAPYLLAGYAALAYPPLTDISTDLVDPPSLDEAARLRTGAMNPVVPISGEHAVLQAEAYPEVAGRRYDVSVDQVLNAIWKVAGERGWRPYATGMPPAGSGEYSYEWYAPSFILGIPTDATVRVRDEGETVFVDMRLNVRYGTHDFSLNARRISRFMTDLDRQIAAQALEASGAIGSEESETAVE